METHENKQADSDTRQRILEAAAELFPQYGIKAVSMDDIAKRLSISKRTLYELFSDKQELLLATMDYNSRLVKEYAQELNERAETVLHVILELYLEMLPRFRHYSNKFHEDLRKYPKALAIMAEHRKSHLGEMLDFFDTGIKQGIFLREINYRILIQVMIRIFDSSMPRELERTYNHSDIRSTVALTLLRGTCTEKGLDIFDAYLKEYRRKPQSENIQDTNE